MTKNLFAKFMDGPLRNQIKPIKEAANVIGTFRPFDELQYNPRNTISTIKYYVYTKHSEVKVNNSTYVYYRLL